MNDPTPAEIRERAAEIRQEWSDAEHYRRARGCLKGAPAGKQTQTFEPWTPPEVRTDALDS